MERLNRRLGGLILIGAPWIAVSAALGHGDVGPRIEALTAALAARPGDPALLLARADLFRQDSDPWGALLDLRAAERADPKLPGVATSWARIHLMRGHPDLALAALDRIAGLPNESADQDELRARSLTGLKRHAEAALAWRAQIESHERTSPDEYHACATAYRKSGDLEVALVIVELGLTRGGPCASLELLAADLERDAGNIDDAAARLQRLALAGPRPESWWLRRATLLADVGRTDAARQDASNALESLLRLPAHVRDRPLIAEQIATARALLVAAPTQNIPSKSDPTRNDGPDDSDLPGRPAASSGGDAR